MQLNLSALLQIDLDFGPEKPRTDSSVPLPYVMTFNLATGDATRRRLSSVSGDFPTIPNHLIGAASAGKAHSFIACSHVRLQFHTLGRFAFITQQHICIATPR